MADFNGDGNLDVAVANGGSNNVSVLMGNGDGTLQTATNYTVGSDPVALAVGDYSGSGLADLVVANHNSNNETVLANAGSGAFTLAQTITLGESPNSIVLTEFNNAGFAFEVVDATILSSKSPLGAPPSVRGPVKNFLDNAHIWDAQYLEGQGSQADRYWKQLEQQLRPLSRCSPEYTNQRRLCETFQR